MLTWIQCIHGLFFSAKQWNINESPTVSFVEKRCGEGVEGVEGGWSIIWKWRWVQAYHLLLPLTATPLIPLLHTAPLLTGWIFSGVAGSMGILPPMSSSKRRDGSLYLLLDSVVAVAVPSLPVVTPLMVPLSEEEVFLDSEGLILFVIKIILPPPPLIRFPWSWSDRRKGGGKVANDNKDDWGACAARSSDDPPPTLSDSCSRIPSCVNGRGCCKGTQPPRISVVILQLSLPAPVSLLAPVSHQGLRLLQRYLAASRSRSPSLVDGFVWWNGTRPP